MATRIIGTSPSTFGTGVAGTLNKEQTYEYMNEQTARDGTGDVVAVALSGLVKRTTEESYSDTISAPTGAQVRTSHVASQDDFQKLRVESLELV